MLSAAKSKNNADSMLVLRPRIKSIPTVSNQSIFPLMYDEQNRFMAYSTLA